MAKTKTFFECAECGHGEPKWLGRCPQCGAWNTFTESFEKVSKNSKGGFSRGTGRGSGRGDREKNIPRTLSSVEENEGMRLSSGLSEVDRVLGGGIMRGSSVLIGGEPGIGKSTLMMQLAALVTGGGQSGSLHEAVAGRVLYVSGEESAGQLKMRAKRLSLGSADVEILCETSLDGILQACEKLKPSVVVVDSIQTLLSEEVGNVPGTVNQLKYCCHELISQGRAWGTAFFFVAHVTKEGNIAGPKVIEHMVDTVLYFDQGESDLRIVRASKNRFGSTDEIALFTMESAGLRQVEDPSSFFMVRRDGELPPGISPVPVYEGSRILIVEIQALTVPAKSGFSRIFSDRIDSNRVSRIAAVLEKQLSLRFSDQDIYVNVAGGIKLNEVGIDLALAAALYSARTGIPVPRSVTMAGEISLAGEVRPVGHLRRRIKAAAETGFSTFIAPGDRNGSAQPGGIETVGIETVSVMTVGESIKKIFKGSGKQPQEKWKSDKGTDRAAD